MTWGVWPETPASIYFFILDETQINLCPRSLKRWDPRSSVSDPGETFIMLAVLLSKSLQTPELVVFTFV